MDELFSTTIEEQYIQTEDVFHKLFSGNTFESGKEYCFEDGRLKVTFKTKDAKEIKLDYLGLCILDAIYSLALKGILSFTVDMIAKVLSGNENFRATAQFKEKIQEQVDYLKDVLIIIDATNDAKCKSNARKKRNGDCIFKGYVLPVEKTTIKHKRNGYVDEGYRIKDISPISRYASFQNRMFKVSNEILKVKGVNNTLQNIYIKRFLIRRIYQKGRKNKDISFLWNKKGKRGGLFPMLGFSDEECNTEYFQRNTKPRIKKTVEAILNHLKNKKVISDYCEYKTKDSFSVSGFTIIYKF